MEELPLSSLLSDKQMHTGAHAPPTALCCWCSLVHQLMCLLVGSQTQSNVLGKISRVYRGRRKKMPSLGTKGGCRRDKSVQCIQHHA